MSIAGFDLTDDSDAGSGFPEWLYLVVTDRMPCCRIGEQQFFVLGRQD